MAGQTINDRLLAARHSLAGQGLAKSVCKATTEEMIGPKKKHLDYLVHCTNEPNVSIPHLANLLIERSQNANWVVVYKALITVHHLLAYGNERFMQYLASSNSTFNLSNFLDKGGVQGAVGARIGYDMSPFIRRYAKYLNEKALSYRTVAFDFCKIKRGKEEGSLRTMNADKLLKTLPVLQAQLDALLEFDCTANDLTNGVINMCFMLLFRDLIRLFACYNDGIINLLEKYFDMNKKQCKDALDLYKKFLVRMDRVGEFLKVAENVGIDKGDIPDLTKAPSSLLDALEQHLATLEGKRGSAANTPTQSANSSFGTAAASTRFDSHTNGIDETIKAQALAEEEAAMNQYKSKVASPTAGSGAVTNPFLSSPPASQANAPIVDLFGSPTAEVKTMEQTQSINSKASDDLLQLGNPFADMFGAPAPAPGTQPALVGGTNNMWMSNGFNGTANAGAPSTTNTFVSDSNFSTVFGNTETSTAVDDASMPNPFLITDSDEANQDQKQVMEQLDQSQQQINQQTGFDALGDVLKPASSVTPAAGGTTQTSNVLASGSAQQQQQPQQQQQTQPTGQTSTGKILTGDLDSSLASLVDNLNINKSTAGKGVQWNSPKNTAKPGANWTPQPMAATTGVGYRPMQGMPQMQPMMGAPMAAGVQMMNPGMMPMAAQPGVPPMMPAGAVPVQQQPMMMPTQTTAQPTPAQNGNKNVQLDPFGAL